MYNHFILYTLQKDGPSKAVGESYVVKHQEQQHSDVSEDLCRKSVVWQQQQDLVDTLTRQTVESQKPIQQGVESENSGGMVILQPVEQRIDTGMQLRNDKTALTT